MRRAAPLAAALLCAALLCACADDHARYAKAVARMDELSEQVDAIFDRTAAHREAIFSDNAWEDPRALIDAVDEVRSGMTEALLAQEERIRVEESILELAALDQSAETRVLYHMDLEAQRAKRMIFVLSAEMFGELAKEAHAGNRSAFEELAKVYRAGVDEANRRYQELDRARQQRQQADARDNPPI